MPLVLPQYRCQQCGYKWVPRYETRPMQCPGCKTPAWDRARLRPRRRYRRGLSPEPELSKESGAGTP